MKLRLVQRIGIDVDDDGEDPGDGAALVDLAELELELEVPFVPLPSLTLVFGDVRVLLEEVAFTPATGVFSAEGEPIWTQTQDGAQGIVDALLEAGFTPVSTHHREKDVH